MADETSGHAAEKQKTGKIPGGVWIKCKNCSETVFGPELEKNLLVCPLCDYHYPMPARARVAMLADEGTFEERDTDVAPYDVLEFVDSKPYTQRIAAMQEKTGLKDAILAGNAEIDGIAVSLAAMDFGFIGGSMGSVVGEVIARTFKRGLEIGAPVVAAAASGGARMQEGIVSLMQLGKTNAARAELAEARLPYIVLISDPTTAGVMASFAAVGDVLVGEPGALMGFAGPRVIRETIHQELPPGFQRAEFQRDHGFLDVIAHRHEIRDVIEKLIRYFTSGQPN
ncbi:MAG: acetyl-CoA carboxylase, carboxyltransferase subunit beta [Candidatus Coatesbacteria bacterium]|nr:MAG: acetyl-CoA carboxylase, carboxyltransferase subunit beta [Candidatus Coatesbacteria bacterium]